MDIYNHSISCIQTELVPSIFVQMWPQASLASVVIWKGSIDIQGYY